MPLNKILPRPVTIVLQSRLSSARLPAKALLPVGGLPLVVLCARRAMNTGLPLVVATSEEEIDELLAESVTAAGIRCYRGAHDNVLKRFYDATADLPEDGILVRITGDNIFPDGAFIEEIIAFFNKSSREYAGTSSPNDRLPYGLSVEAFSVRALRTAHAEAVLPYDREHVTPFIIKRYGLTIFAPQRITFDYSHLRCTVDTFTDYLRIARVFKDVGNPVMASWEDLVKRLAAVSQQVSSPPQAPVKEESPYLQFALGTAQLGLPYGIANTTGMPDRNTALSIIQKAAALGIASLDTARAYGESEKRIGDALTGVSGHKITVVTKLDPLPHINENSSESDIIAAVDASIFRSCTDLRTTHLDTVLLHRWDHRYLKDGIIWNRLKVLRNQGYILKLGGSVQSPVEAEDALADPDVRQIQLPFNILDWRWKTDAFLRRVELRHDVIIHSRSVFLQGLIFTMEQKWPNVQGVDPVRISAILDDCVKRLARKSRADLCIAYVRAHTWINSLVIGIETCEQLETNCRLFLEQRLTKAELKIIDDALPRLPEQLLDPSKWRV
jgi:spore coat polysaccharide biosynthesis protein SpsF